MNQARTGRRFFSWLLAGMFLALAGCATPKIDWNSRVGHYTYDQAVLELGPPDKLAQLSDGTKVAEWLVSRGYPRGSLTTFNGFWAEEIAQPPVPNQYLRLTFNPGGMLTAWGRLTK